MFWAGSAQAGILLRKSRYVSTQQLWVKILPLQYMESIWLWKEPQIDVLGNTTVKL